MNVKTTKPKPRTRKQRANARANHWKKSGVSDATIAWMRATGNL